MSKFLTRAALAVSLAAGTASAAQAAETITAPFTQADGAVTAGLYSGIVHIRVSGTGFSNGPFLNDAFYLIDSQSPEPSGYYQLAFGTSTLMPFDNANAAVNWVVGGRPAYSASHVYDFFLNTGSANPVKLHFGVTDGQFLDNGGAFRITIDGGVPEPATWGLLTLGFGFIGAALRRTKAAVRLA